MPRTTESLAENPLRSSGIESGNLHRFDLAFVETNIARSLRRYESVDGVLFIAASTLR